MLMERRERNVSGTSANARRCIRRETDKNSTLTPSSSARETQRSWEIVGAVEGKTRAGEMKRISNRDVYDGAWKSKPRRKLLRGQPEGRKK